MRIITFNMNGIRAANRKGFFEWFAKQDADILCLQELKAQAHQVEDVGNVTGYLRYCHFAEKPGYSGVALYTRREPDQVYIGLSSVDDDNDWTDMDAEGRYVQADFGNLSVISTYFPSGSSSEQRQAIKMSFLQRFMPLAAKLKQSGREVVLCGDLNIAHQKLDIKNWRGNQKHSGFLPEERAWMDQLLNDTAYVDIFRQLYPERECYTWWSNRGRARENNVGWRIDYHLCTPSIAAKAEEVSVFREQWFSDHAPVTARFSQ